MDIGHTTQLYTASGGKRKLRWVKNVHYSSDGK